MRRGAIVAVGLRPGAVDAAEHMGRPLVAVVEAPPGPRMAARLADVVRVPFDAPAEAWPRVARALV